MYLAGSNYLVLTYNSSARESVESCPSEESPFTEYLVVVGILHIHRPAVLPVVSHL